MMNKLMYIELGVQKGKTKIISILYNICSSSVTEGYGTAAQKYSRVRLKLVRVVIIF